MHTCGISTRGQGKIRTSNHIRHVPEVRRGLYLRRALCAQRLEQPNRRAVHVARKKSDANALHFCEVLQLLDEPVALFLFAVRTSAIRKKKHAQSRSGADAHLVAPRRPVIVLPKSKAQTGQVLIPPTPHTGYLTLQRTKSSNSSASALNLFTNPLRPSAPARPSATSGLNLLSSALSRKTRRGYAIGIPSCTTRCVTPAGSKLSAPKMRVYSPGLQTCSFLRSALIVRVRE